MASEELESPVERRERILVKWQYHNGTIRSILDKYLDNNIFVDATLACHGKSYKVHKIVLSACSPYFEELLMKNPCDHPVFILDPINPCQIEALITYMYKGEVSIDSDQLEQLLITADRLKIRGLGNIFTKNSPVKDDVYSVDATDDNDCIVVDPLISVNETNNSSVKRKSPIEHQQIKRSRLTRTPTKNLNNNNIGRIETSPRTIENRQESSLPTELEVLPSPSAADVIPIEPIDDGQQLEPPDNSNGLVKTKFKMWNATQMKKAIDAIISQRLRFTNAASQYKVPKGTLYDNILGKTNRMKILEDVNLLQVEEDAVLEYCCGMKQLNGRRTTKSIKEVIDFIGELQRNNQRTIFPFDDRQAFKWWWAFCRKHNIASNYYKIEDK